jgi:ATP-dependent RNA helicase RhlE
MKFEKYNIAPAVKRNIEGMGFKRPTDIQFKAIPPILNGEDVLAIAQTGTGKTAAFAIPIVHLLHESKQSPENEGVRCIVMVPTHELAIQIADVFKTIAGHTKVKTLCVIGGVDQAPQIAQLEKGVDVLVATPGRMFDLLCKGNLKLNTLKVLVLDEADRMLELGFMKDIQEIVRAMPRRRQTLFFSATINENLKTLAYSLVRYPVRIHMSANDPVSKNINHSVAYVEMDDKRFFLERVITENPESKILVFVRTKVRAERVSKALERVGVASKTIHSDKEQADRKEVMDSFISGETKVLIATDVSARGLDIPNVDYVINYDLPEKSENYVHRVGRTGRGVKRGDAVSFCSAEEKPILVEIEEYLGKPINVLEIGKKDYIETIDFSMAPESDWKSLMKEAEVNERERQAKKNKKRRK